MKLNNTLKKIIFTASVFISGLSLCFAEPQASSPSPFEPTVVKAFADTLFEEGFLSQAEGEYKRYLFAVPGFDSLSEIQKEEYQSSLLSLCNIYKKQNNKTGINWLKNGYIDIASPFVQEKINLVQADFIFKERNASGFSTLASSIQNASIFTPDFMNVIQVSDLLLNKDIAGLKALTPTLAEQSVNFTKLNELTTSYKTKSPGLALFLSSIIPGCGKWYAASFGSFVSSFLSIGTFAAGTVITGIQTSWQSWQPYVFGACGLVLYITDLYGAYKAAQRYNDALFRELCEETERIYDVIY